MGFADDFKKDADKAVREHVNTNLRAGVKRFGELLIERTPKDTGSAQGGWTASKRARRVFARGTDADTKAPSNEAAIGASDFFAGDAITWSNAAPYIWLLENGSSDQAPQGMLAVTAAEWDSILQENDDSSKGGGVTDG